MKTSKSNLKLETLEDRSMPSASPLGGTAETIVDREPAGEVTYLTYKLKDSIITSAQGDPTPKIVLRWEKIAVPMTEGEDQGLSRQSGGVADVRVGGNPTLGEAQAIDAVFVAMGEAGEGQRTAGYDLKMARK